MNQKGVTIIELLAVIVIVVGNAMFSLFKFKVLDENNNVVQTQPEQNDKYDISMFDVINASKLVDLYKSNEMQVIYIGRETCGYCVQFLPVLQQAQKDYGYKTKYLDITTVTEEEQKAILAKDNSENFLKTNFGATPMVMLIKNGKLVNGWIGYAEYDAFASFLEQNGLKKQ